MSLAPVAAAHLLQGKGTEPILQMTTRDRNRIALQGDMLAASALGITNLVCMGGDPPHLGDHPDAKGVYDLSTFQLIQAAGELNGGKDLAGNNLDSPTSFHIGAVVNPGADDLDLEIERMEEKVNAGAVFFQTQAIYDPQHFSDFVSRVAHLDVYLLAGILPVKSERMASYMNSNVPGIDIPEPLVREIADASNVRETSARQVAEIIRQIKPVCAGIHIMAMGWEELIPRILELADINR
jgi:5,10-methylenetetrahydrofolate reductase